VQQTSFQRVIAGKARHYVLKDLIFLDNHISGFVAAKQGVDGLVVGC
jgi:hypothetical protein